MKLPSGFCQFRSSLPTSLLERIRIYIYIYNTNMDYHIGLLLFSFVKSYISNIILFWKIILRKKTTSNLNIIKIFFKKIVKMIFLYKFC